MAKPDAEQFSRVVLWHLAGLRADVAEVQMQLLALETQAHGGLIQEAKQKARTQMNHELRDRLYREALEAAKIPPNPEGGSENSWRPPFGPTAN